MQFYKYQGAGNDFVLVDQRERHWIDRADTRRIACLCDRHFGIGADGLILLQNHPELHFEMIYFNSDGRESSMCGNGGRCIAAFARHLGISAPYLLFQAIDGAHDARIARSLGPGGEWVELKMGNVDRVSENNPEDAFVLNTGSPHYVRFVSELDGLDMVQAGRAIRYSETYKAEGINVNLAQVADGRLNIRTYERGVENETLACGTGVTAAALALYIQNGQPPGHYSTEVHTLGGDLEVHYEALGNGAFRDIWLCGPAQCVFQGEIDLEIF